ncbi:MAG: two-component regulator propeller domain-containing protein [Bacteroidota bacterium]
MDLLQKIVLFLSFILLLLPQVYSQSDQIYFEQISPDQGLSQNDVNCIMQDSQGFMWFGTNDGLNRYDGYTFEVFKPDQNKAFSINSNLILSLEEDQRGRIWIGTAGAGLSCFDPVSKRFYHFSHSSDSGHQPINDHLTNLYFDASERLWLSTLGGIELFEIKEQENPEHKGVPQLIRIELPEVLQSGAFRVTAPGPGNSLWLGGGNSFFRLWLPEVGKEKFELEKITIGDKEDNITVNDFSVFSDHLGIAATNKGVFFFPDVRVDKPQSHLILGPGLFDAIEVDKFGQIWIGSGAGLAQFKMMEGEAFPQLIRIHQNDLNSQNSISKNVILSLAQDKQGLVWVGTNGGGVNKFDPERKPFTHIKRSLKTGSISYDKIRAIYEDSQDNLWLGTEGGGLNFHAARYSTSNYQHFTSIPSPKNVFTLMEVKEKNTSYLYLGAQANPGLYRIKIPQAGENLADMDIRTFPQISNSVFSLVNDQNKYLWIGTYNGGLYRFDLQNGEESGFSDPFRHDPKNPQSISNNIIRSLLEDEDNNLWIGTGKGLNKISSKERYKAKPVFESYFFSPDDSSSLSHNYILALHQSQVGEIWIGTFGGGLNKFIKGKKGEKGYFKNYTEEDGLSNSVVKGILEDDEGNLWLATNNGISKFDPRLESFKNYDIHDGLQSKEFSELACLKRRNGEMLIGGVNGFNSFFPLKIKENFHPPEVVFTNFEVVNKPLGVGEQLNERVLLDSAISKINHIELKHDENSFSLEFAALHYAAPEKNQFKYKLEGFDDEWITVNSQKRFATYTNIEPGDYTIYVKASNNDGVWNETPASISIYIAPPFWKTGLAYVIYASLLIGFLVAIQLYTVIGIKEKHALVLEHIENERIEELHQLKLQYFTNISHELKTPLTLISGPMDYLINSGKGMGYEEREHQYHLIKKNTNYLLRLVNQLLEFRKLDRGKMQLKVRIGEIEAFIREISEPFQFVAKKKEIDYQIISNQMKKSIWYDQGIIEKVLYNLLSNAFKYTPKHGRIEVELVIKNDKRGKPSSNAERGDYLELRVSDTGPGIPAENQEKIFERYFNNPKSGGFLLEGTGIGLAYTKSLVELHKGSIRLQSKEGKGASFTVILPVDRHSYFTAEVVENEKRQLLRPKPSLADLAEFIEDEDPRELRSENSDKYQLGLPYLLLVDDNKDLRDHIRGNLKNTYNILEAANGKEGLKIANEMIPDLIVSDIMMPIMDGIEFGKALKMDTKTSHIPIIMLTGKSSEESEIEGLKIGVEAYIPKPFNMEKLKIHLENILKQRSELNDRFRKQIILEPEEVTVSSTDEIFLSKAMALVEEHMADPDFNVENMVQGIGMSRSKLYLKLKALTGQSTSEFIRTIRLKRAVQLLESSDLTVKEIMYMTGFNTASYFSKCFKKQFGVSPSDYVSKFNSYPVSKD